MSRRPVPISRRALREASRLRRGPCALGLRLTARRLFQQGLTPNVLDPHTLHRALRGEVRRG